VKDEQNRLERCVELGVSMSKTMVSAKELAAKFNLVMEGKDREIENLGKLCSVKDSLLSFAETRDYLDEGLSKPNVCALIIDKAFREIKTDKTLLFSNSPRYTFYRIHNYLVGQANFYRIKTESVVSKAAQVHKTAFVSENNVRIFPGVIVGPNVTILENCVIDRDTVIQAGAVIGSQGFECVHLKNSVLFVLHGGGVRIGKNVNIGANTCVDKGVFDGDTVIGKDAKIDNLVHVAHNVIIGERVQVVANSGLGGSVIVGDDVWVGFNVTILPGLKIGNRAFISIGAIVTKDVSDGTQVTGNFAISHNKFLEHLKGIR